MKNRLLLLVALITWSPLSGCLLLAGRHWDQARAQVIEPINSALHRHLPKSLREKDLDAVLAYYDTERGSGLLWQAQENVSEPFAESRVRWRNDRGEEPLATRYREFLAAFDRIERAELRIHRVFWEQRDALGYPADVRLFVRGTTPDGGLRSIDQHARVHIDQRDNAWKITAEDVQAREMVTTSTPAFEVATERAGVSDVHDPSGSPPQRLLGDIQASSGSAVADFDCDGLEDLALLSTTGIRFFHNRADGSFEDVTAERGVESLDNSGTGLVFFDADNDGDPDLWISGIYGERVFVNQDCRRFVDVTATAGIAQKTWSSMPLVADYDLDGDLDVYVIRMGDHDRGHPSPNWDAHNGLGDSLYRNDGDLRFTDVTRSAGIEATEWGLAGGWGDYDNDGDPDLFVGNEFGYSALYRNNGDATFTEVGEQSGARDRSAAMGVAWGDYDNDGDLDIFVSNMYANSRWALFHPEFPPPVPWYLSWVPRSDITRITDELSRGSSLIRNNGDGTFTDVSDAAGIRDGQWGWGAEFLDYNNDGHLDILATNGFITGNLPDDV